MLSVLAIEDEIESGLVHLKGDFEIKLCIWQDDDMLRIWKLGMFDV
jgi:hypothetical protein